MTTREDKSDLQSERLLTFMLIQATGDIITHVDMYHQLKSKHENFTAHHLSITWAGVLGSGLRPSLPRRRRGSLRGIGLLFFVGTGLMVAEEEEERDLEKNNPWIQDGSEADERQIWRGRRRSWGRAWETKIAARQAFVWLEFE